MHQLLTDLIVKRITEAKDQIKQDFFQPHPIKVARHFALDNLLPTAMAKEIYQAFPKPSKMSKISSAGKIKLKYCHLKNAPTLLQDINRAIQNPRVVALIEEITEIKGQIPDPTRFAGGISTLLKGYYINPHLDNSHELEMKRYYRTVNMLYYVSPDWSDKHGGNYELWDEDVNNRILVPSLFNRLVVMETNSTSWHAVNPVLSNNPRCCIFNYYFSEHSPEGRPYFFNTPSFKARPEQTIRRSFEGLIQTFKNKAKSYFTEQVL